jgi:hypothetical protein
MNNTQNEMFGTGWFPRGYLKNINDSTYETSIIAPNAAETEFADPEIEQKILSQTINNDEKDGNINLEEPAFAYFNNGNKFVGNREVSSLYSNISSGGAGEPNKLISTYPQTNPMDETMQQILYNRGGNNSTGKNIAG